MSVVRKCFSTVLPKLPVPPVIKRVLSLKIVSAMMASLYVKRRRAQVSFIIFIILP